MKAIVTVISLISSPNAPEVSPQRIGIAGGGGGGGAKCRGCSISFVCAFYKPAAELKFVTKCYTFKNNIYILQTCEIWQYFKFVRCKIIVLTLAGIFS